MSNVGAQAKFLQGSIMRHIVIMTLTGAVGLMAVFLVDLADLYFLSRLHNNNITAAIGFAGTIAFVNLNLSIGTGIAAAALVARNMGMKNPARAKEFATSSWLFTVLVSTGYTILTALFLPQILTLLGAKGEALEQAKLFVWTLTPGFVFLAAALSCSFTLRGIGDAQRAMYITLTAAIATLILDPIFIFKFGWGIQGAAAANAIADFLAFVVGMYGLIHVRKFLSWPSLAGLKRDFSAIWQIAFPAVLTQLATPFTIAYTIALVAPYGEDAVTSSAIVGRLVPVAFGVIFSLSGSVGPVIGQNFGAGNFTRVREALWEGMKFSAVYTIIVSIIIYLLRNHIAGVFSASPRATELVVFFATYVGVSWAFAGAQFVAAAAFNNLGRPGLSTWFNWGKATLGTIPFALVGAQYWGPEGIMLGTAIGAVLFGIASAWAAFYVVGGLEPKVDDRSRVESF
jgi:putative MATE family efflux protein